MVTQDEHDQLVLTPREPHYEQTEWIASLAGERRAAREQLDQRRSIQMPADDLVFGYEGQAWPTWPERQRDAILQPPKPDIRPAQAVLERAAEAEAEAER